MRTLRISQEDKADIILFGGVIATANAGGDHAEAVAVSAGRIVYVGPDVGTDPWLGSKTKLIDLKGRMVLPGFHDGHIHAVGAAAYGHAQIALSGLTTREALLSCVGEYVRDHPARSEYMGIGWSYASFPQDGPTREELDALCPDKPVFLLSGDGHTAWVNSAALVLGGIDQSTPDPPGGRIQRHPLTAAPTGWLKEAPAFKPVLNRFSLGHPQQMEEALMGFFERLSAEGITSILQPGMELFEQEHMCEVLSRLDRKNKLPVRILGGYRFSPRQTADPTITFRAMKKRYQGRLFKVNVAKLFLDGVMEARTARLLDPYLDSSGHRGEIMWQEGPFEKTIADLDREGAQIHIHTIGDGAVRMALDSFEKAIRHNGPRDSRHTLVHLDLTHPSDIARFRRLGVIACFQPAWFHVSPKEQQTMIRYLGEERAMSLYRLKSFWDQGAVVTCGSDYFAGSGGSLSFRPLEGMEMGVTRRALGDAASESYSPQERVSLDRMIDSYTSKAAFQFFHEEEVGSIEVGKQADLAVLDRNLYEAPVHTIHEAKVLLTLLEGREVHRDPSLD